MFDGLQNERHIYVGPVLVVLIALFLIRKGKLIVDSRDSASQEEPSSFVFRMPLLPYITSFTAHMRPKLPTGFVAFEP